MRIVSGRYRGRKLSCPEGDKTRPTLDRVKENLFNLLGETSGLKVLDLFSGSGGLGIEALSRGASEVVFCDSDRNAVRYLRQNLDRMDEPYRILECDFLSALAELAREGSPFDLVLLDPPYRGDFYDRAIDRICSQNLLAQDGVLAVETDTETDFSVHGLEVWKERRYGAVRLYLLKRTENQSENSK